eukprot:tig00021352_g20711.t1
MSADARPGPSDTTDDEHDNTNRAKRARRPPTRSSSGDSAASSSATSSSSLALLTKRFIALLAPNGSIDLNAAADKLSISKRRLYDIINTLEGVQLIEKLGKNSWAWRGPNMQLSSQCSRLREQLASLQEQEREVESIIEEMNENLISTRNEQTRLPLGKRLLFLTQRDIMNQAWAAGRTLIAVHSQSQTGFELQGPEQLEGAFKAFGEGHLDIFVLAEKGEVPPDPDLDPDLATQQRPALATENP